jgi:HlyD family secretion protein
MTDARLSVRGPVALGCAALVVLVLGLGVWATQTTLSGAIIAPGRIEVEDDRQILQHPDGGVVTEILVRDGDRVAAGDILIRLDDTDLRSQAIILDDRLSELAAVTARLQAERDGRSSPDFPADLMARAALSPAVAAQIDGQLRLFSARLATLNEAEQQLLRRIGQARAQSEGIIAQRDAVETQLALVDQELAALQSLHDKGLASQSGLLAIKRERARLSGQIGELAASLARIADQVTEIEIQISALTLRRQEEAATALREIGPQMLELTEARRALAARIARLDLRAPVAGSVLGLQITTPGAVLRAADPALFIVPQDRGLVVVARIAPLHIDEIALGQPAELVLSAFPPHAAPRLTAEVTMISADTQTDPQTGLPHYLARLTLTPAETARLGDRVPVPGMPVEVFLQTAKRTPLAYLLAPFSSYFARALREG